MGESLFGEILERNDMEIALIVFALSVVALAAGVVVLYRRNTENRIEMRNAASGMAELSRQRDELSALLEKKQEEVASLTESLTDERVENARLKEKIGNMESFNETLQQEAASRFKVLANDIFEHHAKEFRQNSESRIGEILKPLKEKIADFEKTVTDSYVNEAKEMSALSQHLQTLMELNKTIGKEARDLTGALVGNTKVQGDWGEMILETILEKSGLVEGENYIIQATRREDGSPIVGEENRRLRPDVVVMLPDKKFIVIDSKVSLTAYVGYMNAETDEERERYGKAHVLSVRKHLKELEAKKYQDFVGASDGRMDFVLMFIPNEHAYMTAMSLDRDLWSDAYDKRVIVISPAHVISTLRLVAQLWTRDKQTKNALKIAEEGGKLYDKFVGFVADVQDIGNGIRRTQDSYDKALNKLQTGTGNLISRVQKLKELGAKTEKMLPER